MDRRKFFGALAGTGASLGAAMTLLDEKQWNGRYGLMTVERHHCLKMRGVDLRVLVDGKDVTDRCNLANDAEGWAVLFKHNSRGATYLTDTHEIARETVHGKVRFGRVVVDG